MATARILHLAIAAVVSTSCGGTERLAPQLITVVNIDDGDSFTVRDETHAWTVRVYGIDCPELDQPHGRAARRFTSDRVLAHRVSLEPVTEDAYGRTVANVYEAKMNLGHALLAAGLAWHYKRYDLSPTRARLEQQARRARRGLWADPDPTPPWVWRQQHR